MKLTVVYDNDLYRKDIGLQSDWGFSCLIESKDDKILFDTGTNGEILLNNIKKLNIDPFKINKIVISHEHKDHNGGLQTLIPYIKDALGGGIAFTISILAILLSHEFGHFFTARYHKTEVSLPYFIPFPLFSEQWVQ